MQVVKALAQECVRNKQWNEAFVAALKELGVEVEIPVKGGIEINPASNLPKGSDLIGVECYVWGEASTSLGERCIIADRTLEQRCIATLTHYCSTKGYSWGTCNTWFSNAIPVWFGEPETYVEVTEGLMVRYKHQFLSDSMDRGNWETVYGIAGQPVRDCIVRARRDGRDF